MTTAGRHAGLAGKTVVVAGTDPAIVGIARALVREGTLLAVVSADHHLVAAVTRIAETAGTPMIGLTSDPSAAEVWERNAPHIEQRLGPIDIAIAIGPAELRELIAATFLPDMRRRHHGVFVEAGVDVPARELGDGVLHRFVHAADTDADTLADSVMDALRQRATQG